MIEDTCIVCDKPVKAKRLCSTHHQRMLRTGSPYRKGDHRPVSLEIIQKVWNKKQIKGNVSLAERI